MNWRIGSKVPLNVYEGDRPVCQCHTVEDAARIVEAMNQLKKPHMGNAGLIETTVKSDSSRVSQGDSVAKLNAAKPHEDTERLDKWISVKERLPEPNVSVLVFMPNTEHYGPGIQRAIRVCPTAGPEPGLDYRWHGCAWMIGRDIPSYRITHWMPLPSIPDAARLASPQPGE